MLLQAFIHASAGEFNFLRLAWIGLTSPYHWLVVMSCKSGTDDRRSCRELIASLYLPLKVLR